MPKKPTSDAELIEYQKEVCVTCHRQIDLKRRKFTKGCAPVDMGMTQYDQMINDEGVCSCHQTKGT